MPARPIPVSAWYVYLLECQGGFLYTGISTDVERRFRQHVQGKGARYTRSHPPSRILFSVPVESRSAALKLEIRAKKLAAIQKRTFFARLYRDSAAQSRPSHD